jgi:hypothetical protein
LEGGENEERDATRKLRRVEKELRKSRKPRRSIRRVVVVVEKVIRIESTRNNIYLI